MAEILGCMNKNEFSLRSMVLHSFNDMDKPEIEEFFVKHCFNLEKLELENCFDPNWNYYSGPFVKLVSRTGSL